MEAVSRINYKMESERLKFLNLIHQIMVKDKTILEEIEKFKDII